MLPYTLFHVIRCDVSLLHSDEADDCAGERGSEPQHQPGQHTETVRGRAEQSCREKGHRQAGAAAGKEEGGTVIIIIIIIIFIL